MDGLVAVGVPLALAIRLTSVVATLMLARHARVCRWAALGASIVASVMTAGVAVHVIASAYRDRWHALPPRGVRNRARVLGDPVVGVVSHGVGSHRCARRALQCGLLRPRRRPASHGRRRRRVHCDGRRTRGRVRRRWRHCVPLRLGSDDPGDGGSRRDGTRVAREPPRRVSLPGHVARRNRLSHGRFPDPGVCGRFAVVPRRSCPDMSCRDRCGMGCSRCSSSGLA